MKGKPVWYDYIHSRKIEKSSNVAYYAQLIDILLNMINSGLLKEHDKLPTEEELINAYGISRIVIRQALKELQFEGHVYRLHGKGTFVNKNKIEQELIEFYSFTERMKSIGKKPSSELLEFKKIPASLFLKNKLSTKDSEIFSICRLRYADDELMYYEVNYLPCTRFSGLRKEMFIQKESSLYDIFYNKFGIRFTKSEETFIADVLPKNVTKALNLSLNTIGIKHERVTFDKEGKVEYTCSFVPRDKYIYRVILSNNA